jgi:transcription initiation factor IIE alpha subunit
MYKIGLVGLKTSVERIMDLAEEYKYKLEFITFPYVTTDEIEKIVEENDSHVHAWLFSGPIPYEIAKKTLGTDKIMVHAPATESGFYHSLIEMIYEQGKIIKQLSIDAMSLDAISSINIVEEAVPQLNVTPLKIYTKVFKSDVDLNDLLHFHLNLWNKGKTEGAFSCFPSVCEALREKGVPAYRMSISKMEIQQTLRILYEKVKASYFKDTQIGVEIIEVEYFNRVAEEMKTPYHLQYLELRLKEMLIQLCQKINGSFSEKGNGIYMIFSSRGAIEQEIKTLEDTIQSLAFEADTTVAVGIGFGETAYSAEINAFRAIQHSKEMKKREIVIVQDDGKIVESPGKQKELHYTSRTHNEWLLQKLKKGNIGVKTYKKILALVRRMGWHEFTTKEIATHLEMTERNVRRIVASMCEVELAQCVGEKAHPTRGRPSKIYRLL